MFFNYTLEKLFMIFRYLSVRKSVPSLEFLVIYFRKQIVFSLDSRSYQSTQRLPVPHKTTPLRGEDLGSEDTDPARLIQ